MASRFILPFADVGSGIKPSSGARLFFYETGTNTFKNTFTDQAATTPNANPVIADSNGVFSNIFINGTYKVILQNTNSTQIWEADPIISLVSKANGINTTNDIASMKSDSLSLGDKVLADRFYANGDFVDDLIFDIVAGSTGVDNNGDFHDLDNGNQARLSSNGTARVVHYGARGNVAEDATSIQAALDAKRNISLENDNDLNFQVDTPLKIRNATNIFGGGQQATRIGDELTFYTGVRKTNNSTVVITNPQRPTQTVDCLFYSNGEWEDGKFPQLFKFNNMAFKSDSAAVNSVGMFVIQGSGIQMDSVEILDFDYAFDCYEMFASTFKKVRTNGKMRFQRGTSVHLDQCASGGSANAGLTGGGFIFEQFRYSTLTSTTSDGTLNTSYKFNNSYSIEMNGCGCEFVDSVDDDTGTMIHFDTGNQVNVNGFYGVDSAKATKANFGFGQANTIRFYGGKTAVLAESVANFDVVITGNSNYIEFHQFQFNDFSYNNPNIRFNAGVVDSFVVVYGKVANVPPKVYYTDGTGATLVRNGIIDTGTTANGTWIRFDDGTQECYHTLPKTGFLIGSTASTTVQGIIWYRSNVVNWLYPLPFIASDNSVQITPRTGSAGARFASTRYSNTGETNAQTGQIQLIGVEDYIAAGVGYTNLTDVKIRAIGRWK
jgi:hypothetical protein